MDLRDALCGITCPTVTPFDDGAIDDEALDALLEYVEDGGIDAVFPCGTTGEFASLPPADRRRVIERTVDGTDLPVIAGAAATTVKETLDYVSDAAEAGADAAVVVPPYFHSANVPAGNVRFFREIANRASIPLLLYNIPQCSGRPIDPETVATVSSHERIVGIKDSSGDFNYFQTVGRRTPDDFLLLQGFDALLVPALRMGADGGVNALSNVFPDVFRTLFECADAERGRQLQQDVIAPVFDACLEYGFAPTTKAALVHRGVIPSDEVRPPLVPVDDPSDLKATVRRAVEWARL